MSKTNGHKRVCSCVECYGLMVAATAKAKKEREEYRAGLWDLLLDMASVYAQGEEACAREEARIHERIIALG